MDDTEHCQAFLDFLNEDVLLFSEQLDTGTLAAVCAVEAQNVQSTSSQRKRSRSAGSPLDEGVKEEADDECAEDKADGKRCCKQDAATLARNKACREKARREKLNDRFSELAQLVEPGTEPKTDKLSIINDAIKFVAQMKVENSQLKQLNKFLEERVRHLEKERSQMLYQQALYQGAAQQQASMHAAILQHGALMPQPGMMPGMAAAGMQPLSQQQQMMQEQMAQQQMAQQQLLPAHDAVGLPSEANMAPGAMMMPPGSVPATPAGAPLAVFPVGIKHPMELGSAAPAPGEGASVAAGGAAAGTAAAGADGMLNGFWVPASMLDASRDSQLRPPAA